MNKNFGFASIFIMIALALTGSILTYCATLQNSAVSLHSRAIANLKHLELLESSLPKHLSQEMVQDNCVTIRLNKFEHKRTRRLCAFFPWRTKNTIPDYIDLQKQAVRCPKKASLPSIWQPTVFTLFACNANKVAVKGDLLALHGDLQVIELTLSEANNTAAQLYVSGNVRIDNLMVEGTAIIISGGSIKVSNILNEPSHKNIFLHSASKSLKLPELVDFSGNIFKQQLPSDWPNFPLKTFSLIPVWQESS